MYMYAPSFCVSFPSPMCTILVTNVQLFSIVLSCFRCIDLYVYHDGLTEHRSFTPVSTVFRLFRSISFLAILPGKSVYKSPFLHAKLPKHRSRDQFNYKSVLKKNI